MPKVSPLWTRSSRNFRSAVRPVETATGLATGGTKLGPNLCTGFRLTRHVSSFLNQNKRSHGTTAGAETPNPEGKENSDGMSTGYGHAGIRVEEHGRCDKKI